jgi:predicted ATP-dependent serine protease
LDIFAFSLGYHHGSLLKKKIMGKGEPVTSTNDNAIDSVKRRTQEIIDESFETSYSQPAFQIESNDIDIVDQPFVALDMFIHRGEIACIVSPPGVGKTFLAIHIARDASPEKTVYFNFDDTGSNQAMRFLSVPSIRCINREQIDRTRELMKANAAEKCYSVAIFNEILTIPARIEGRRQKLMRELGINDQRKIDDILLFEIFAESKICSDAEIIIIDSLNGLFQYEWRISRDYLDRITRLFRDRGQTLIILHHTNKKGEIAGHSSLSQTMVTVLQLDKLRDNYRKITVKKNRYPQGDDECIVKMVSRENQVVVFEVVDVPPDELHASHLRLEDIILSSLENNDTITFEELLDSCNSTANGLKNCLKRLEDKRVVSKADGKTWKIVKNCKSEENNLA